MLNPASLFSDAHRKINHTWDLFNVSYFSSTFPSRFDTSVCCFLFVCMCDSGVCTISWLSHNFTMWSFVSVLKSDACVVTLHTCKQSVVNAGIIFYLLTPWPVSSACQDGPRHPQESQNLFNNANVHYLVKWEEGDPEVRQLYYFLPQCFFFTSLQIDVKI